MVGGQSTEQGDCCKYKTNFPHCYVVVIHDTTHSVSIGEGDSDSSDTILKRQLTRHELSARTAADAQAHGSIGITAC
ncbi:COBRA-like extracellular glycosyl-phosphatidyl inositol-anchored protein family [Euphorbia peplus]|nr:COBRA-like extracellular glycosyl-phosphatidyl inositol-anchored protein family [Euphorbia peplus]